MIRRAIMEDFNLEKTKFPDFFRENKELLKRSLEILNNRRRVLLEKGINIFPENGKIFEVLEKIEIQNIKRVLILPHPYNFNSGTGIPCMIKTKISRKPKSLVNIQKVFGVEEDNFDNLWKKGTLLYNVSLTEEEESSIKIPHEIFWSTLSERFLKYLCNNTKGLSFYLSGALCNKYKKDIDRSNDHKIYEIPAITDDDFQNSI